MSKRTAILTPSYMKPYLCYMHVRSMEETSDAHVYVSVWKNDPSLKEYMEYLGGRVEIREMREFGPAVNHLWKNHPGYDYYFMGSDDVFGTPGWLDKLIERVNDDGISLLWPNDSLGAPHRSADQIARFPFATGRVLDVLGFFALPGLSHYFIDDAWTALSKAIGRYGYVEDSIVEHRHTPAPQPGNQLVIDESVYRQWDIDKDVKKLLKEMK